MTTETFTPTEPDLGAGIPPETPPGGTGDGTGPPIDYSSLSLAIKRARAWEMFLEERGTAKMQDLAGLLGVSRRTIHNWKIRDKWAEKYEEIQKSVMSKATEIAADKYADQIDGALKKHLDFYRIVDFITTAQLFKKKSDGGPECDENGQPIVDTQIPPNKLRDIVAVRENSIKMDLLLHGHPTENVKQSVAVSG